MHQASVLLVDDDRDILECFEEVFSDSGFSTRCFETAEACEKYVKNLTPADQFAVVSDYVMPGKTGFDLFTSIGAAKNCLGFVLVSGKIENQATIDEFIAAGVSSYFAKPVEFGELVNKVQTMFASSPSTSV